MSALFTLVLITCFIQLAIYLFVYTRFLRLDTRPAELETSELLPVTVAICARNEAENIKKNLPLVLDQDYPSYEVVVIDDASEDGTAELLSRMEKEYPQLLTFRIEDNEKRHGGKKQALSQAVLLARYNWIVVTDADCCPAGNKWLLHMASGLAGGSEIVLGVSPYFPPFGNLLQHWAGRYLRAETLFTAIQYMNFTLSGLPFMGVGRNMAFTRSAFDQHDMGKHWDLISGDDDLFVSEAKSGQVAICAHLDGFTYSDAPPTFRAWYRQKLRHFTTGYRYSLLQKVWLGYYWLSSLLLYATVPLVVYTAIRSWPLSGFITGMLVATLLTRWAIIVRSLRKLGEHKVSWSVPIFDVVYILAVWILSPLARLGVDRWK